MTGSDTAARLLDRAWASVARVAALNRGFEQAARRTRCAMGLGTAEDMQAELRRRFPRLDVTVSRDAASAHWTVRYGRAFNHHEQAVPASTSTDDLARMILRTAYPKGRHG